MVYRTGNPALNDSTFDTARPGDALPPAAGEAAATLAGAGGVMTLEGTVQRSFLLVGLVVLFGAFSFLHVAQHPASPLNVIMMAGGAIAGFITAMVLIFKKHLARALAPLYAMFEGITLGAISAVYEAQYQGIVLQSVELTVAVLLSLLLAYTSKLIKPTENFKLGVVAATGGIAIVYLVNLVMMMFGHSIPFLHDSGPVGIGVSLFIVLIAALNLVLDFDFIEKGTEARAPQYMEWYASFGLLVTLVWLYLEILRLMAKLRKR